MHRWSNTMTTHTNPRSTSIYRTLIIVGVMLGSLLSPLAFRAASAPQRDTGADTSGGQSNTEITYRLFNEVMSGETAVASAGLVTDTALIHTPEGSYTGAAGLDAFLASLHASFSATEFEVNDLLVIRDMAFVQWTMTGTPDGSAAAPVVIHGLSVLGFDHGMIVDTWLQYDRVELARQIESSAYTNMENTRRAAPVAGVQAAPEPTPFDDPRPGEPH
jgi:hypothetical protein